MDHKYFTPKYRPPGRIKTLKQNHDQVVVEEKQTPEDHSYLYNLTRHELFKRARELGIVISNRALDGELISKIKDHLK